MKGASLILALLWLLLPVEALPDHLLTFHHTERDRLDEKVKEGEISIYRVWIGEERVREVTGRGEALLRLDRGRLYIIDHQAQTYNRIGLPVKLEEHLRPSQRETFKSIEQAALDVITSVDLRVGETPFALDEYTVTKVDLEVTNSTGWKVHYALWMTEDLPDETDHFLDLMRLRLSLVPGNGKVLTSLSSLKGFPVVMETTWTGPGIRHRSRDRLIEIEESKPPGDTYRVPRGYRRVRFDPLAALTGEE